MKYTGRPSHNKKFMETSMNFSRPGQLSAEDKLAFMASYAHDKINEVKADYVDVDIMSTIMVDEARCEAARLTVANIVSNQPGCYVDTPYIDGYETVVSTIYCGDYTVYRIQHDGSIFVTYYDEEGREVAHGLMDCGKLSTIHR